MVKRGSIGDKIMNELGAAHQQTHDEGEGEYRPRVDRLEEEEANAAVPTKRAKAKKKLLHKAPLDASYSEGKYSAHAAADFEADLDGMFGLLEADDLPGLSSLKDEKGLEQWWETKKDPNQKARAAETDERKRSRKRLRELEQEEELEKIHQQGEDTFSEGDDEEEEEGDEEEDDDLMEDEDGDDAQLLKQITQLRDRQRMNLTTQDAALGDDEDAAKEESTRDGQLSREYVGLFTTLLSLRLKTQRGLSASLRLPQYYALEDYLKHSDDGKAVRAQLKKDLRATIADLLSATGEASGTSGKSKLSSTAALWNEINSLHKNLMAGVDRCVTTIGSAVTPSHQQLKKGAANLKALNQPLLEQIKSVCAGKVRLLERSRRNRVNSTILGHPAHWKVSAQDRALRIADGNTDPEIFDDPDFVKELVQHHGGLSSMAREAQAVAEATGQGINRGAAKKGHHRRTKGRTVSYDPRPKIVGYAVSKPYDESVSKDALFASLWGK